MMPIADLPTGIFQHGLSGLEWQLRHHVATALQPQDLTESALIFAPHPDDETLGCGGTIIRKRAAGADVRVAFMTNGDHSHTQWIPAEELARRRYDEGVAACRQLGLSADAVYGLNFPDNCLNDHHAAAVEAVRCLLRECCPQAIFMPYIYDITPDHEATARIVLDAIHAEGQPVILYEYPIWVWNHFPWMRVAVQTRRQRWRYLTTTLTMGFGLRMISTFRHFVDVQGTLERKYLALAEHHTQMKRLVDDPSWAILSDISDGHFLACFFQGVEIFRRSVLDRQS